ncbi:MAG: flavodoxin-dependent (E)-4-hydroxy-3-methylbut-2-enyl-diphosphate synthase [Ruminococcaceae bacterium]|nr:flavodoxin-dependent (E)-4-hydroxy-3-methylbut-2-enyl-diphosphate synthase [Oscillospiraceae bacterium]
MIYNNIRRKTEAVTVGGVRIGGSAPIVIQSMTNTDTLDVAATVAQIRALEERGCDVVRISVPTLEAANTMLAIRAAGIRLPVVADIHFDYKIALRCAEVGFDKIRINPGNIGDEERVRAVCRACNAKNIPIRIGVNSGSLEKHILAKFGAPTPQALCESALYHIALLEKFDFHKIVVSIKASTVADMISANRLLAQACPYPLHLGVTEAGGGSRGQIKSAIGIGALLCDGIGDTIRVSLTDDPTEEIDAAKQILQAIGVEGQSGLDIVSCPTCSRTKIDLIPLVKRFEEAARAEGLLELPVKVALMGCVVNGPGEAREADVGIAGGIGEAVLFRRGEIIEKIPESAVIERLLAELRGIAKDRKKQ